MHADLHDFLTRLARTMTMTLVPGAFTVFFTMPASLHDHVGNPADVAEIVPQHVT